MREKITPIARLVLWCATYVRSDSAFSADAAVSHFDKRFEVRTEGKAEEKPSILAAACLAPNGTLWTLPVPARHHHILHAMHEVLGWNRTTRRVEPLEGEARIRQGFVLSNGEFVERAEAAQIALAAWQVTTLMAPPDLYSEDLW